MSTSTIFTYKSIYAVEMDNGEKQEIKVKIIDNKTNMIAKTALMGTKEYQPQLLNIAELNSRMLHFYFSQTQVLLTLK